MALPAILRSIDSDFMQWPFLGSPQGVLYSGYMGDRTVTALCRYLGVFFLFG